MTEMFRVRPLVPCVALAVCATVAQNATAAFTTPSDWTRPTTSVQAGTDLTSYQRWETFGSTTGPNAPDVASINLDGSANAFDSAAPGSGSFITSGGNIYAVFGVIKPRVIVPHPTLAVYSHTQVLVQVKTFGNQIDTSAVTVEGLDAESLSGYSYSLLSQIPVGDPTQPGGGYFEEHAWTFDVPFTDGALQIDFGWGVDSASLDQLAVDTRAVVPEPVSLAGLVTGGALLLGRRRRGA